MRIRRPHFISQAVMASLLAILVSCENKPLHDNSEIKPREIHEEIQFHFDEIEVDGVEYLILEKDNNNPHEGFGFMAFRANKLMEKQDSILAYMRTVLELNTQIYARVNRQSLEESQQHTDELLNRYMGMEQKEISQLEEEKLSNMVKKDSSLTE